MLRTASARTVRLVAHDLVPVLYNTGILDATQEITKSNYSLERNASSLPLQYRPSPGLPLPPAVAIKAKQEWSRPLKALRSNLFSKAAPAHSEDPLFVKAVFILPDSHPWFLSALCPGHCLR